MMGTENARLSRHHALNLLDRCGGDVRDIAMSQAAILEMLLHDDVEEGFQLNEYRRGGLMLTLDVMAKNLESIAEALTSSHEALDKPTPEEDAQ